MVANVSLDSAAVMLLSAYNSSQQQMTQVQDAVASGQDVNKASDNPLFYLEAQNLRGQASAYNSYIPKLTQDKAALDKLQSTIQNISDTASKIRDQITSLSANPSAVEEQTAAINIKSFLNTINNLINSSNDNNGFSLNGGKIYIDVAPNKITNLKSITFAPVSQTMTFNAPALSLGGMIPGRSSVLAASLAHGKNSNGYFEINVGTTNVAGDLTTATNRAALLGTISGFIDNTLTGAAASVGAFSNSLDAVLSSMQTNQNGLNAEADALTKTDLTADSAKSTALSTQQQLLTSLLSMSNQRMSTILGLFR